MHSVWNKSVVSHNLYKIVGPFRVFHSYTLKAIMRGQGGRVVTLSPPTSEAGVRSLARPQVGKLVVASRWSAVYSTEP